MSQTAQIDLHLFSVLYSYLSIFIMLVYQILDVSYRNKDMQMKEVVCTQVIFM